MLVLVLNQGSSSLKFQLRRIPGRALGTASSGTEDNATENSDPPVLLSGVIDTQADHRPSTGPQSAVAVLHRICEELNQRLDGAAPEAIGHRVVHGGERFTSPTLITDEVIDGIESLGQLAPLHNPVSAAYIRAAQKLWPDIPQVAVFDTAFHRTLPDYAYRYALPEDLYGHDGVRRFGFHGISVESACQESARFLGCPLTELNAIVAHLGNGASITAIRAGQSVDTSMGMTPLEGLVMGTRSGDIDPSIVVFLQRHGLDAESIEAMLNGASGLLGLSGFSDMRDVEQAAEKGHSGALLARDMAAYRLAKYIGAYNLAAGGSHALVFTGGIGEHDWRFRARTAGYLEPLGISLDPRLNELAGDESRLISAAASTMKVLVVPADEEQVIAAAVAAAVAPGMA